MKAPKAKEQAKAERKEKKKATEAHALKASAREEVQPLKTQRALELAEARMLKEAEKAKSNGACVQSNQKKSHVNNYHLRNSNTLD